MIDGDDTVWMARARREIGMRERVGYAHNPRILEYHGATRLQADEDEIPWGSSFACWVMEGSHIASTRSAAARSWLGWGVDLAEPRYGCIVVLERKMLANPQAAHVGFYVGPGDEDGTIQVLGGNQLNQVCIRVYDASKVLAYRWPESP